MSASVRRCVIHGFDALLLENASVRAAVIPQLGGRVWEIVDRLRGRQWVWHHPKNRLTTTAPGSAYDDVWAGGWEELFPNDAPCRFEGKELPDHGEWWAAAWTVAGVSEGRCAVLRLQVVLNVRRVVCEKEYRLGATSNTLEIGYRIESREKQAFHFLFKQHLPVAIDPDCEILAPGGTVKAVDAEFGNLLSGPGPFDWPATVNIDGLEASLETVPPASAGLREFVYVSGMPEGWCAVRDSRRRAAIRMRYEVAELPYLWLFLTYGGWRECYTAVLEPCTNMPKDLAEAARLGQSAALEPGRTFETRVTLTLTGVSERD